MSDINKQLENMQQQIDSLRLEVKRLKRPKTAAFSLEEIDYFENLPSSSVVGKDYVAWRFGCSTRAVLRGERSTDKIRRVSKSPLKFIKREVDAEWEKRRKKPMPERAAEMRKNTKTRVYSVVKKQSAS